LERDGRIWKKIEKRFKFYEQDINFTDARERDIKPMLLG
jgi:hypothetical protein